MIQYEIYSVRYHKYKLQNGDVGYSIYTVGVPKIENGIEFTPTRIKLYKDRIYVTFSNAVQHVFWFGEDVELFKRPIEEELKTEEI
jgi:hypothetical protein